MVPCAGVQRVQGLPPGLSTIRLKLSLRLVLLPVTWVLIQHNESVDSQQVLFHAWLLGYRFATCQGLKEHPGYQLSLQVSFQALDQHGNPRLWVPALSRHVLVRSIRRTQLYHMFDPRWNGMGIKGPSSSSWPISRRSSACTCVR